MFLYEDEAEKAKAQFIASDESKAFLKEEVYIDKYYIDQREWSEGFTRWNPNEN